MTKNMAGLRVPQERQERDRLRLAADSFVRQRQLVPPLSMEELETHVCRLREETGVLPEYQAFLMVLLNNAVWRSTLAAIPFSRRVLLLPQCLRDKGHCPAEVDAYGVDCQQCGSCGIGELQAEAEELGYVVLVAEGTTVVTRLLEGGKVDAVVGVSCLSVLEKAFPHMAANAIPGVAVPLIQDGCDQTAVDRDWVRDAMHLRSDEPWAGQVDMGRLKIEVDTWFERGRLREILGVEASGVETVAHEWLSKSGKRWRPLLVACVYEALRGATVEAPDCVRRMAVAVECFHKASLVHDDIEDNDDQRYGELTLHRKHGVPIALNIGDFLLGEGYRMIAAVEVSAEQRGQLLEAAVEGHRMLSLGQGEELAWRRDAGPMTSLQVIEIFRKKTAPAFEVALKMGAICAGADAETCVILREFSEALGIAFQIKDDIEDGGALADEGSELSILTALSQEMKGEPWPQVVQKAHQLMEHYRNQAVRSLSPLRNAALKGLLRRVAGRIVG